MHGVVWQSRQVMERHDRFRLVESGHGTAEELKWGGNYLSVFMRSWAQGSRHKVDAEVAAQVCENLEKNGGLTAKRLVDVSRPEDAPLHCEFEWDDGKAAELYRQEQGRAIIRHLVTVETDEKGREQQERMIYHVPSEQVYMSREIILTKPDALNSLKQQALKDMISFKSKYKRINELGPVLDSMTKAQKTLQLSISGTGCTERV